MNWDALAAVAELVAALGVIVSLAYLATQIRQNTRALRASTVHAITERQQHELHWSHEISQIYVKAIETPDRLDSTEVWSLSEWLTAAFLARQNEYLQHERGLLDESVWNSSKNITGMILSFPWARNWWEVYGRGCCVPEFADYVDRNLKDGNPIDFKEFIAQIKTGGV